MVKKRKRKFKFTPVSIPTSLFDNIKDLIKDTGFPSVSSFATYILREIVVNLGEKKRKVFTEEEMDKIEKKLSRLGYLE
jgi:hypothetical protein